MRIHGDQAENLEEAIRHIELALTVFSRQLPPEKWAKAQNNLGLAFQSRKRGDRAENIEKAISLFLHALQVFTPRAFPEDWAVTQNYLGFAYEDRIRGDQAENTDRAIGYFQQALEVFTLETYPEKWAHTHQNLIYAYKKRKNGDRTENFDQAIHHCLQALEVFTRQVDPNIWALCQTFLALIYMDRKRGEVAEYTGQAITHYQKALEVFTQNDHPEQWSRVQAGLAAAYNESTRGDGRSSPVINPPFLSYPQFYDKESQQQLDQKRNLKLAELIITDFSFVTHLVLLYQWEEDLPNDEANRLAKRAIAYVCCAIYDAACSAGLTCQPSEIPNGSRPAWILEGEKSPVSLTLSDIDLSERTCQMTIGAVLVSMKEPSSDPAHWEKLREAFNARFSEIIV